MAKQTFGLGRGLGSLIPKRQPERQPADSYFSAAAFSTHPLDDKVASSAVMEAAIGEIKSNKYQPRRYFADKELAELAESIKAHGILQPLVVVRGEAGGYDLIAGERRLRAAKAAGLARVPVIIRDASELERLELALIENIQRADLNPIEEAEAYKKLNDDFGLTHDAIAKRVGKSRSAISNCLRLLSLPSEMQLALAEARITAGHAKVLMEIKDEAKRNTLFKQVLQQKLTISDTSGEARKVTVRTHARHLRKDPNLTAAEERLRESLGTKVSIRPRGKNGGEIIIAYYGEEELRELMEKLT